MNQPRRRFRPPWWATLGTVLLGALFLAAGTWQLNRAGEKRALYALMAGGGDGPALAPPGPGADLEALRYRRVAVTGRYDADRQVLLDARTRGGRAGYEVITPLRTGGVAILVNRGWVPANPDRRRLPDVAVGDALRDVTGRLDLLPRAAMAGTAPAADPAATWPRRMLFPAAAEIADALGYPVAGYQLLLDPGATDGYRRDWSPSDMTPEQHLGYAVQWFALATALVVLYVVLNLRKTTAPGPEPS